MKRIVIISTLLAISVTVLSQKFSFSDSAVKQRFIQDISLLASDSLFGRESGTLYEKKAYDLIISEYKKAGLKIFTGLDGYLQPFTFTNGENIDTAYNVIGYIDNNAKYTVVIGAHYDHLGKGDFGSRYMAGQAIHNGADDNASGTAMVMELARYIKHHKLDQYNYLFAAFAAEERGLLGSKYFCKSNTIDMKKVNYYVNFDMIGRMRKLRNKLFVLGTNSSPQIKETIKHFKYKKGRLKKYKGAFPGSDHTYFNKNDVPFLYFTSGLHSDYHTPSDDVKYINFKGMVKTAQYVENIITDLEKKSKLEYTYPGKMAMIGFIFMYLP